MSSHGLLYVNYFLIVLVCPNTEAVFIDNNELCEHGTWDAVQQKCDCFAGWTTAGITDTLSFLEGVCEQYQCQSDQICQQKLGIASASCPVRNWNCYCGWDWAFANIWTGWETPEKKGGAKCMGVMYTFSVWTTKSLEWVMSWLWVSFAVLALVALPFGRKREICDHHWPSLWNGIRKACGHSIECRGECVMPAQYSLDFFKDDIAWTIYILDIGIWCYIFLATFYLICMFIWSVVLWAIVCLLLIVAALASLVMFCGGGCDGGGGLECGDCSGCGAIEADCCCCCPHFEALGNIGTGGDVFYFAGSFPSDHAGFYYSTDFESGCCGCGRSTFCFCLRPLAWLFFVFPLMPENAWGGLAGYYLFGTHALCPASRTYLGDSALIEFLNMRWLRGRQDLHRDDGWRSRVYNFLWVESDAGETSRQAYASRAHHRFTQADFTERATANILMIGRAKCYLQKEPFNLRSDRCVPSSFDDYQKNVCWICQDRSERDSWDLWLSCRHLFCSRCSEEMLRRRMPCPLCRVASSTVKRAPILQSANAIIARRDSDMTMAFSGQPSEQRPLLRPPTPISSIGSNGSHGM